MLMKQCLNTIKYLRKPTPPEIQLLNVYNPSEVLKNGEVLFPTVVTVLTTYGLFKYLK